MSSQPTQQSVSEFQLPLSHLAEGGRYGPAVLPAGFEASSKSWESWLDHWSRRWIFHVLERCSVGHLVIHDGDQMVRFGNPEKFDDTPNVTLWVYHPKAYTAIVLDGDIGLAESYMVGDWDTNSIKHLVAWFIGNIQNQSNWGKKVSGLPGIKLFSWGNHVIHWLRRNSKHGSQANIHAHYDLSNDFFRLFLDESMTYSSGIYTHPSCTLEEAQQAKMEALCQKLRLQPTDHVLEIGTGWGAMACYMATHYGCRVTSITISQEQYSEAIQRVVREGLEDRVEVRLQDYRNITGQFDKIVSVEMIEAVGDAYYETFFRQCHQCLGPNGLMAMQLITCPDDKYEDLRSNVDFIQKHIFPGSLLPSLGRIHQALARTGDLSLMALEDIGLDYGRTLGEWYDRFNRALPDVYQLGFDDTFVRKWNYYLQYCEAAFATRNISVVQAVFSRSNNRNTMEGWACHGMD